MLSEKISATFSKSKTKLMHKYFDLEFIYNFAYFYSKMCFFFALYMFASVYSTVVIIA